MSGPDYRTAREYWQDKAHAEKRARLEGAETQPTKNAARQRLFRARRSLDGLIEVRGIFAPAGAHESIKAHAVMLTKRHFALAIKTSKGSLRNALPVQSQPQSGLE